MTFSQLLNQQKIKMRKENITLLRKNINTADTEFKLQNHIKRFGYMFSIDEIKEQIIKNDLVASLFCKDPSKQNIAEEYGLQLLKLQKLPASGKNCIRFSPTGEIVHIASGNTKSADTIYNGYYTTMKYTEETGGAQDNQKRDVIEFLEKGSKQHKVCAIVDGSYWNTGRKELKNMFKDNPNVLITSIDEILNLKEE